MRSLRRNRPAAVLALVALGLAVALALVLLHDDTGTSTSDAAPPTSTVDTQAPLRGGRRPVSAKQAGQPDALRAGGPVVVTRATSGASGKPSFINVTVDGQTGEWNGQTRAYETASSFRRAATLIVQPDGNFALVAGAYSEDTTGRLMFVTNTSLFYYALPGAVSLWAAAIPTATVTVDSARGIVQAVVGGPQARAVPQNNFNVQAGLRSPRPITQGRIQLTFANGHVTGQVELYGGGAIEPGNSFPVDLYRATVSG